MSGKFVLSSEAKREQLDWGLLGWLSSPGETKAKDLVVIEVELNPGGGHDFHKHPDQEEVIYVVSGEVEQWLEKEGKTLTSGDSIFIDKDVVHASFNTSSEPARLLAILGPCIDSDSGYDVVEVADQEPWASLR